LLIKVQNPALKIFDGVSAPSVFFALAFELLSKQPLWSFLSSKEYISLIVITGQKLLFNSNFKISLTIAQHVL